MIIKMNLILGVALLLVNISLITADDNVYTVYRLINALKDDDYNVVSELSKQVNDKDHPERFNEVISQVLQNDFDKINLYKLVKYFATHDDKEERIFGYIAIFNELKRRNELYRNVLVKLAFGLKDLLKEDLSNEVNSSANQLKNALPESVRNLAFAGRVCITNSHRNEKLYAAEAVSRAFNYYASRRTVRAHRALPADKISESYWIIESYNDGFHVKNYKYNEYMYAPGKFHIQDGDRAIYTWVEGGYNGDDEQTQWLFEAYGDFVIIRDNYYKEYLFIYDENNEIETPVKARKATHKYRYNLWKIEDCDQK